jgi:acyl-CoA reductase-like NAD-dependent aldehyde dehydrogenase
VHRHVQDAIRAGAELVSGGTVLVATGARYPNTVLGRCTPAMAVLREPTFGPVAPVCVVDSFETGLRLAAVGSSRAATVLTRDMCHAQLAWQRLPAATVKINSVSGGGGYGPELLDEMTTTKVVHWADAC